MNLTLSQTAYFSYIKQMAGTDKWFSFKGTNIAKLTPQLEVFEAQGIIERDGDQYMIPDIDQKELDLMKRIAANPFPLF